MWCWDGPMDRFFFIIATMTIGGGGKSREVLPCNGLPTTNITKVHYGLLIEKFEDTKG